MEKRGISSIVSALLIIMVVVASASLLWAFVQLLLTTSLGGSQQDIEFISVRLAVVESSLFLDEIEGVLSFLVERLPGGGRLDGFIITLESSSGQTVRIDDYIDRAMEPFERIAIQEIRYRDLGLEDVAIISVYGVVAGEEGSTDGTLPPGLIVSTVPLTETVITQKTGGGGGSGSSGSSGSGGGGNPTGTDSDGDGVDDGMDNCVNDQNYNQQDVDADGVGDACDPDVDNDGVDNNNDLCIYDSDSDQTDSDGDGIGDACDYYPNYGSEEMKPFFKFEVLDSGGNDLLFYRSQSYTPVETGTPGVAGYTRTYTHTTHQFEARVIYLGNDEYRLEIDNNHPSNTIESLTFPWEETLSKLGPDKGDDIIYYPQLMGYNSRPDPTLGPYSWKGPLEYPALSMPLFIIWDSNRARLLAATNYDGEGLEPRKVRPMYAGNGPIMAYPDVIGPGESDVFQVTDFYVEDFNLNDGIEPWQRAADRYHSWLTTVAQTEGVTPRDHYDPFLKNVHGWYNRALMNSISYSATNGETATQRIWNQYKEILPWVQVWGQMSNYAGQDTSLPQPPLYPGEITGCCLFNRTMHYRYLQTQQGVTPFPDVAQDIIDDGGWVGYYVRPLNDDSGNQLDLLSSTLYSDRDAIGETPLSYLQNWIDKTYMDYNANTQYIDVLAAGSGYGSPLEVARLFRDGQLPINGSVEGVTDLYPVAFMASGTLSITDPSLDTIGPGFSLDNLDSTPAPEIGRYILREHIFFLGQTNNDNALWFGEDDGFGTTNDRFEHWGIRQAFLLGAKFDVQHPFYSWGDVTVIMPPFKDAIDARENVDSAAGPTGNTWWVYDPLYLDTYGLIVSTSDVDVRRFEGTSGETLLAIENWNRADSVTLSIDGVQRTIVFEDDLDEPGVPKRFVTYLWE